MNRFLPAAALVLAVSVPAPAAHAQRATPTPAPAIGGPLLCARAPLPSDPTVPVETCTYPSGTGTSQVVRLQDPTVDGTPLLFIRLPDGTTVWAPVAEQLIPNAWGADNGPLFRTATGDGRYPRCSALAGVRNYYAVVLGPPSAAAMLAATTDGSAYCRFSIDPSELPAAR